MKSFPDLSFFLSLLSVVCACLYFQVSSVCPTPVQLRFFLLIQTDRAKWIIWVKSRILREQPAAKPFTSSREEGKTHAKTRTPARTHTHSLQFGPLCTRRPPPCTPLHTAPRPLPEAPGRVRGSGAGLAAPLPNCGCCPSGPGSPAPRAGVFGQRQPPGGEELRPVLQHGGGSGGRAAVGPALAAVTGAAAQPRLPESGETPAGAAWPP